jgi:phosphotransferase system HPr (HPr) family protein
MKMFTNKVTIIHEVGLHARPAALLVKTADQYEATITLKYAGRVANAKSLLGVLGLGANQGAEIIMEADGEDAEKALAAIQTLIENNFGEE